jgi:hypothetical protein
VKHLNGFIFPSRLCYFCCELDVSEGGGGQKEACCLLSFFFVLDFVCAVVRGSSSSYSSRTARDALAHCAPLLKPEIAYQTVSKRKNTTVW